MLNKIKARIFANYRKEVEERYEKHLKSMEADFRIMIDFEKNKLVEQNKNNWLVDPEMVFSVSKAGNVMLGGQQITANELKNLKAEVKALKDFEIWKVLQHTLRAKAIEKAVLTSTDLYSLKGNEQVLGGKMMVFSLDVMKTIIQNIGSAKN